MKACPVLQSAWRADDVSCVSDLVLRLKICRLLSFWFAGSNLWEVVSNLRGRIRKSTINIASILFTLWASTWFWILAFKGLAKTLQPTPWKTKCWSQWTASSPDMSVICINRRFLIMSMKPGLQINISFSFKLSYLPVTRLYLKTLLIISTHVCGVIPWNFSSLVINLHIPRCSYPYKLVFVFYFWCVLCRPVAPHCWGHRSVDGSWLSP